MENYYCQSFTSIIIEWTLFSTPSLVALRPVAL
jgi:hypothetical protein